MSDDKWIAYLLLGIIAYTIVMIYLLEQEPVLTNQINNSVIIGLLLTILIKIKK